MPTVTIELDVPEWGKQQSEHFATWREINNRADLNIALTNATEIYTEQKLISPNARRVVSPETTGGLVGD